MHDGAVFNKRPPRVEGDDATRAALVVFVLDVFLWRLRQVLVVNQLRNWFCNWFLDRRSDLWSLLFGSFFFENLRLVILKQVNVNYTPSLLPTVVTTLHAVG